VETQEGTNKWYVYTFIADRPVRSVKAKIRALTHKTSQWHLAYVLTRLGQIMRGWANYFKHAVAKHTFSKLDTFTWWRLAHMLRARHGWNWGQLRRNLTTASGRWQLAADGVEYFRIEGVKVSRYAYRGQQDPNPMAVHEPRLTADTVESPLPSGTAGSVSGPGKRTGGNTGTAPRADSPCEPVAGSLQDQFPEGPVVVAPMDRCAKRVVKPSSDRPMRRPSEVVPRARRPPPPPAGRRRPGVRQAAALYARAEPSGQTPARRLRLRLPLLRPRNGIPDGPGRRQREHRPGPLCSYRLGRNSLTGRQISVRPGLVGTAVHGDRVPMTDHLVTVLDGTLHRTAPGAGSAEVRGRSMRPSARPTGGLRRSARWSPTRAARSGTFASDS